eukprot:scaffold2250_cov399-Prasinococcus_capsulatus_cf.AAC.7
MLCAQAKLGAAGAESVAATAKGQAYLTPLKTSSLHISTSSALRLKCVLPSSRRSACAPVRCSSGTEATMGDLTRSRDTGGTEVEGWQATGPDQEDEDETLAVGTKVASVKSSQALATPKELLSVQLEPIDLVGKVLFGQGRTKKGNLRVVEVKAVEEGGEAWQAGIRPGQVVRRMSGTNYNDKEMRDVDEKISIRFFLTVIRLSREPVMLDLEEGLELMSEEDLMIAGRTAVDERIAMRKDYQSVDDSRNDFPLLLGILLVVGIPPAVILAWYFYVN